jgi:two-component system LytT family response regulator
MKAIRGAVFDEDPLARERILRLLRSEEDVEIVGQGACCDDAAALARETRPNVVFLNIHTPPVGRCDIRDALGSPTDLAMVYVTTYERSMVRVLDWYDMNYLLKPFDVERFRGALRCARASLQAREKHHVRSVERHLWRSAPRTRTDWNDAFGFSPIFSSL